MRQYEKRMIAAMESIANSLDGILIEMQMDTTLSHMRQSLEIISGETTVEEIAEKKRLLVESFENGSFGNPFGA